MVSAAPASVSAVGWGWRHAGRRRWAVRGLDLRIDPGERVMLLGASGSGKSTLVSALAGVLGTSDEGEEEGELRVDGRHPAEQRGRSGLLLQDPDSQVVLARVGDDIAFGCENLGVERTEIWRRVRSALDAVGLDVPLDHSTSDLSGGQKQRLALAGILAMRPGLLLLDEPTANLDPQGVDEVRDAVAAVVDERESTLVVIEHRVSVWRELVDRVIVIGGEGSVVADGTPTRVFASAPTSLRESGVWFPESIPRAPHRTEPQSRYAPILLDAADLSVGRYRAGSRVRAKAVLAAVDLAIPSASTTAITGPNGVGKSTLALTLGGLIRPIAGRVIASNDLRQGARDSPISWTSRELLTRIGNVFQSPEHQFLASTVREELAIGPRALRQDAVVSAGRIDELLVRLRLDTLAEANPFTLSGGQKRRLSVATALATRPSVLLLDEPTFGQDAATWSELVELLTELSHDGHAIVAVTHDAEFVQAIGAREYSLGSGRLSMRDGVV